MAGQSWTKHNTGKKIMFGRLSVTVCDPLFDLLQERSYKSFASRGAPNFTIPPNAGGSESKEASGSWYHKNLVINWVDDKVFVGPSLTSITLGDYDKVRCASMWPTSAEQKTALGISSSHIMGVVLTRGTVVGSQLVSSFALRLYQSTATQVGSFIKELSLGYPPVNQSSNHDVSFSAVDFSGTTLCYFYRQAGNQSIYKRVFDAGFTAFTDNLVNQGPCSAMVWSQTYTESGSGTINGLGSLTSSVRSGAPALCRIDVVGLDFYAMGTEVTQALASGTETVLKGTEPNPGSRNTTRDYGFDYEVVALQIGESSLTEIDRFNLSAGSLDHKVDAITGDPGLNYGTFNNSSSFRNSGPTKYVADYEKRVYLFVVFETTSGGSRSGTESGGSVSSYATDQDHIFIFKESTLVHKESASLYSQNSSGSLNATQSQSTIATLGSNRIGNGSGVDLSNPFYGYPAYFSAVVVPKLLLACYTLNRTNSGVDRPVTVFVDPVTGSYDIQEGRVDNNPTAPTSFKFGCVGVSK